MNTRAWTSYRIEGRVLLVDDASDNRRIISYFLTRAGAEVLVAEDGRQALEIFEAEEAAGRALDAIVTDMEMPEIDGYELARTLRLRGALLPIIACTAHSDPRDLERCYEAGCSAHAAKPIIAADLIRTMADALVANRLDAEPAGDACLC